MFAAASTDGAASATGVAAASIGVQNIDALISGARWSGTISYSFPDARGDYQASYAEANNGFGAVSFSQQQAARYILEGTSSVTGGPKMTLTAVEQFTNASISDAGFNNADIRIAKSSSANPTAYAYYPSSSHYGGDVWFGTSYDYSNPRVGNYQYATMMHELGHALGLKHGHQLGGVSNVALTGDRDSLEFSVMTYRSYVGHSGGGGYTNETYGYAQTFMMYDIAALQQLYGANFTTNNSNTIYSWNPTTGESFVNGVSQGAPGGGIGGSANRIFLTIWDGGGIDTYDFSNYTSHLDVDLAPGGWSLLSSAQLANLGNSHYARGNVFNALQHQGDARSLIENAIGGSGPDNITGNTANNMLRGSGGSDTLRGLGGEDWLEGGFGQDVLWGGNGADAFVFRGPNQGADRIEDFGRGDSIWLDALGFGIAGSGTLSSVGVSFTTGIAADARPAVIHDTASGNFYWDADGAGASSRVLLGTVKTDSLGYVGALPNDWLVMTVGDISGDRTDDVVLRNSSTGQRGAWIMSGAQAVGWSALGTTSPDWEANWAGDFNCDGTDDLLWRSSSTGQTTIWLMSSGQAVSTFNLGTISLTWQIAGMGDFNQDGTGDVLWRNSDTGQTGAWLMASGQPVGWLNVGAAGLSWKVEGTADFNSDGTDDVLWRNTDTGQTGAWLIASGRPVGWLNVGEASLFWQVAGTGDFNHDGTADVLFLNSSSGQSGAWLMCNGQPVGWADFGVAAADYQIRGIGDFNQDGNDDPLWWASNSRNVTLGIIPSALDADDFILI